ncbi:MAG: hypothetical protein IIZ13_04445 [Renibacterium sp.]|nr:hypothetical protein [Renibacterium sp.]
MSVEDFVRAAEAKATASRGLGSGPLAEIAFNLAWVLSPAVVLALTNWLLWQAAYTSRDYPAEAWPPFLFGIVLLLGFCVIANWALQVKPGPSWGWIVGGWIVFLLPVLAFSGLAILLASSTGSWRPSRFEPTAAAETASIFRAIVVATPLVMISLPGLFAMLEGLAKRRRPWLLKSALVAAVVVLLISAFSLDQMQNFSAQPQYIKGS